MSTPNLQRLAAFVADLDGLVSAGVDEASLLARGKALLANLVKTDDWLPDVYAAADKDRYQQYLLYRDPAGRFSVVSFVWGPGQSTPVHNHTVWGLIGVLRGGELSQGYEATSAGLRPFGAEQRLEPGAVEAVSPAIGDIHRVANAYDNAVSVSIHVYGADIGAVRRATFDAEGRPKSFISGYAPTPAPDLSGLGPAPALAVQAGS